MPHFRSWDWSRFISSSLGEKLVFLVLIVVGGLEGLDLEDLVVIVVEGLLRWRFFLGGGSSSITMDISLSSVSASAGGGGDASSSGAGSTSSSLLFPPSSSSGSGALAAFGFGALDTSSISSSESTTFLEPREAG